MNKLSSIIILVLFFYNCTNNKKEIHASFKYDITLPSGEWISETDSLAGLSIRKNNIAFFKNMSFTMDEVCEYIILDSILFKNNKETVIGEYLLCKKGKDSLVYKITKRDSLQITLSKGNKKENYNFWR